MKKNKIRIYLNPKQQLFAQAPQPTKLWMGGRGTGKSTIEGKCQFDCMVAMPRAKSFLSSSTYGQILTKTLPAMEEMWNRHLLREHIPGYQLGHYVIGKKPPKNWDKCRKPVRDHRHCITFFNGYTIEMLSMDRPDLARGGSYDTGGIDEAYLVEQEELSQVIIPSIRGNETRYNTHLHQQLRSYFTVPWKSQGEYLYEYEEKARLHPTEYFWMESKTVDNIKVIGQKAYDRMRRDMNYLDVLVELDNQRFTKSPDAYYNAFDDTRHTYQPMWLYDEDDRGISQKGYKRTRHDGPLDLSFDFSGWFNCMTIWQEHRDTVYCIDNLDVTVEENIDKLVKKFIHKYAGHKHKHVNVYGEFYGHNKRAEGETLYERVERLLNAMGWTCDVYADTPATSQEMRYEQMNEVLDEHNINLPKIRISNECKSVIISLKKARVKHDMSKDKSMEKNRSANQAEATHYTDTVDYYYIQKFGHRLGTGRRYYSRGSVAGVA